MPHVDEEHVAAPLDPFTGSGHTLPQVAQLLGSLVTSTHPTPAHSICPGPHEGASVPASSGVPLLLLVLLDDVEDAELDDDALEELEALDEDALEDEELAEAPPMPELLEELDALEELEAVEGAPPAPPTLLDEELLDVTPPMPELVVPEELEELVDADEELADAAPPRPLPLDTATHVSVNVSHV